MRKNDAEHESRLLCGQTVAVTRMPGQASLLIDLLRDVGAEVIEAPTIQVTEVDVFDAVDAALRDMGRYAWLVLTSVNGVDAMFARLTAIGLDRRSLAGPKVAAVGSATTASLVDYGVRPDLVPGEAVGEALAEALIREGVRGSRVLLLRSDIARRDMVDMLAAAGATCDDLAIYRTVCPESLPTEFVKQLDAGTIDWLTLTSPSSMNNMIRLLGPGRIEELRQVQLASIGPVTTKAIREAGFFEAVEADPHDAAGLVAAIVKQSQGQNIKTSEE